ncbi:aminopeptidase N [Pararhizobium haloflavum]|uniref:aminopeptidase N n=1 Tax=Pararhizobium haloflavum TaxID=2037914 RepID=UPI000C194E16|nr:aminopeptidase N [Pararhizobium haloflavum]
MRTDTGQVFHLEDYRPTDFIIDAVSLTFRLAPQATRVISQLTLRRRPGAASDAPLVLDGDGLNLVSLAIGDAPAEKQRYTATPEMLTVHDLPESETFTLTVETEIDPSANSQLMGLYRSSGVYCTQCEAEGFRRITYFLDRPDVLSVYTVRMEAETKDAPLLLSNGNPVESGDLGNGRHFAVWHDPHPKPSYLFALVAGDLGVVEDEFTTMTGKPVVLKIFVEHGKEARAAYAMDALKRSMRWDEEVFGREYDLDIFQIVAVSDFNMGAMENKGLNVFNDKYVLADPDTATDQDYANIEAIIAHEYFHNWTGNRITCRDWFQLCLKEGLTVYRDHEFSADQRSRPVKRIAEVRLLKAHQFPEDAGPLAHPPRPVTYSEINNFYTATVYEKGSEVVRMIRTILGADGFRKGMDLYFERHDGEAATIEDFIKAFEDANDADLSQFAIWYRQAGTPAVSVSLHHDANAARLTAEFEQSVPQTPGEPTKKLMHIPLRFALLDEDGSEAATDAVKGARIEGDVLHLTERRQSVVFEGVARRPVLSLNRGFSAPITLNFQQTSEDLAHIARHESDAFARWQGLNDFALRVLIEATRQADGNKPIACDPLLVTALVETAADDRLEPAFRAQALTLPSEADVAREIGNNIDPDAIHRARDMIAADIAKKGADVFRTIFEAMYDGRTFSPDADSAGRRALRSVALHHLSLAEGDPARAFQAFGKADNMTDLSGALSLLVHHFPETPAAREALEAFEKRFAADPLVIDKWLTVQATSPGPATLSRVKALMETRHFSLSNPNRVRALIGAFAAGNPTGFNRADGAGYVFLAEQVTALDGKNPQVAARLLTAMRSWRSLEPVRQAHASDALRSIAQKEPLSTDVRDIVKRTLG